MSAGAKVGKSVEVSELRYVCVKLENKKRGLKLHRIFVSGLFKIKKEGEE